MCQGEKMATVGNYGYWYGSMDLFHCWTSLLLIWFYKSFGKINKCYVYFYTKFAIVICYMYHCV